MEKSVQQLKDTLIKENEMYKGVLKLAEEKMEAIIKGDIKTLEDITKKEQKSIMSMNTFEKIRRSVLANIAVELKIQEDFTVSELLLFLGEDVGNDIDKLRYKLLETIDSLKEVNKNNERLINQNLQYINFNLEILTQSSEDGNKYNSKASENKKVKPINLFDAKV
ncbi:MAG: flagellar protein FlgN [Candidatus Alkaliphilus sp. MAG34]|nr:flagellar protein FlgN [Clostridiales bacterium]